jgi:hypothetical protein
MHRCVDGTRDVTYFRCCTWLVMQASHARFTYVVSDPLTDLSRGWSLWLQCGGKMTATQFSCTTLVPVWTNANHGFLATEIMVCLSKVLRVP